MKSHTLTPPGESLEEMLNDCSIDAIIAIDTNKNIIAWNATAENIYNKTKDEVIGMPLLQAIPSMAEDEETLKAISLARKGMKAFVPASKAYFHRRHAENHFIPLIDETGIKGVMNLVHDVAHRIKAEEQLQQLNEELEKRYRQLKITSEELASFTYITSNKIKEPIRQVYTGIEHLIKVEASRLTDSGKASFRRMQSSLNRMDLLLDDVLSLAQISILQKPDTSINLNELVQEVISEIKNKSEKNPHIIAANLFTFSGHKNYLHLLFYNLLDNAIKFNESHAPEIKITCQKVNLNEELNNLFNETEYFKVTISDNGIGFAEADKERIFLMFEKLHDKKYKGSGMGLTTAQKIMQAHNGFIQAESEPGKGSSFHCFFPVNVE